MEEILIGTVTHYFGHLGVAAISMTDGELRAGDTIHVKGHTSDFQQSVESIQKEHQSIEVARKGDEIGIKVKEHARVGDVVFRVE